MKLSLEMNGGLKCDIMLREQTAVFHVLYTQVSS